MRKKCLYFVVFTSLFLILNQSLFAQEEKIANKTFYAELGGGGILMSVNFDKRFDSNSKLGGGFRIGIGYGMGYASEWGYKTKTFYSIPVGLNYVFGKPNSTASFELGGGITFLTQNVWTDFILDYVETGHSLGYFTFMFRLAPPDGGFSFRVGYTPLVNLVPTIDWIRMGAISLGYAF